MLVLTRKVGEKIVITTESGERIEVLLTLIEGKKARIGVIADRTVTIWREELSGPDTQAAVLETE